MNTPTRIDVLVRQSKNVMASESKKHLRHVRPIGSNDTIPRKRKTLETTYERIVTLKELTNMKGLA